MNLNKYHLSKNVDCGLCSLGQPLELINDSVKMSRYAISAPALQSQLISGADILLLDVRSYVEYEEYNLGGVLIPLTELKLRLTELSSRKSIVVYCHSGQRSVQALKILMENNLQSVKFLQGGIVAWKQFINDA